MGPQPFQVSLINSMKPIDLFLSFPFKLKIKSESLCGLLTLNF